MAEPASLQGIRLLSVGIEGALEDVVQYLPKGKGDFFCLANIHLLMEAQKQADLMEALNQAAGNFPDGMGVAWALKLLGSRFPGRVRGTDLMLRLCSYGSEHRLKVFLYGNTEVTLAALMERLRTLFPGIEIAGAISPPFRDLTREEDEIMTRQINETNPAILFVSLGAPKQEKWMADHKGRIKAVQLGVGAAFDFIVGKVKQAPVWMQRVGLEWLYRMPQQPKKTIYRMSLVPSFVVKTLLEAVRR